MKVIIAGSRSILQTVGDDLVRAAIFVAKGLGWQITEVVCGEAHGIDACGRRWAEYHGVHIKSFPANWKPFAAPDHERVDRQAGFKRNAQMAAYADALIAITTGSPGTAHMIRIARAKKLPVIVIEIPEPNQNLEEKRLDNETRTEA